MKYYINFLFTSSYKYHQYKYLIMKIIYEYEEEYIYDMRGIYIFHKNSQYSIKY